MTQISDLGLQQILLDSFQRAQGAAQERQIQVSTGKVTQDYSGLGGAAPRLLEAESVVARATAYEGAADAALARLSVQEAAISELSATAADLRAGLVRALATGASSQLPVEAEGAAARALSALGAQFGGVFVFGGADGQTRPIAAGSASELAAADPATLFPPTERTRIPVEEGRTVDGGATAGEVGAALTGVLRDLLNAPNTVGAFQGELSAAQRDLLTDAVARLDEATIALNETLGFNGVAQAEADRAAARQVQRRNLAEQVVADIEDVNLAEAVAGLDQDRLAIEAAAEALGQASALSLINFL